MIVALAGGVGGARMAAGLSAAVGADRLIMIVNTADDFEHMGLAISPDLDTVLYTLAGLENAEQGWGLAGETWGFMEAAGKLGGETWFRLGDRDLATHVMRTQRLAAGGNLSAITADLAATLGVATRILPVTNSRLRTVATTDVGELQFQDYFVRRRCEPKLVNVRFEGAEEAKPTPEVLSALGDVQLDAIVICPSNPYVSIDPIMAVPGISDALRGRRAPLVAVSPIVGGKAIKGPAAKMMAELGVEVSALGIARHYQRLVDGLVIDEADRAHASAIKALGIAVHVTDTIMRDGDARRRLAEATLGFARTLRRQG